MSEFIAGKALRKLLKGLKVDRPTATLPQTTAHALFTVVGGRVAITQIVGEVTTIIQTQANNTKLTATPDIGTAVDLCTVLSISADEVGCLYGITGLNTDAMIGINAGVPAPMALSRKTAMADSASGPSAIARIFNSARCSGP